MFEGPFRTSILSRAVKSGRLEIDLVQLREFATDERKSVDEAPFGGGPVWCLSLDRWLKLLIQ